VHLAPEDSRQIEQDVNIIPPRGISVISDIDDTLKISQVAHRRQLLHNTFLNPFATVPGMAPLYQHWEEQGAAFHYVSSSPWQLFEPLNRLLLESGFPVGSYHLRSYRFGDPSIFKVFISKKRNKYNIIKSIFRMFPQRRFVLVGDSGEKDAEIYGKVARKFPQQVERILIRRVEGRPWTRQRVAKAFRKVPEDVWQSFRVPTQIRDIEFA
jgi:phosphatidate phosphatase APP1